MSVEEDPVEALELWFQSRMEMVHTMLPARIQSYNKKTRVAVVKPSVKHRTMHGEVLDIKPIPNVPVLWPSSSAFSVFGDLVKGDGVLLVFAESAIGSWMKSSVDVAAEDETRFSLQDAVAIAGLWSKPTVPTDHNLRDAVWGMASKYLAVGGTAAGLAVIKNSHSDLRKELERIYDEVKQLRVDLNAQFTAMGAAVAGDAGFMMGTVAFTATAAAQHLAAQAQIALDKAKLKELLV